ncbi:MAG: hypothetical protein O3C57_06760 [Verrucomicrobia bacterium]|nr:hypothetical protein [Verrucomicrobiota bacterium]
MLTAKLIVLWLHILCMVGCFGMVLGSMVSARAHTRETLAADRTLKVAVLALVFGLLAGIVAFVLTLRLATGVSPHFMMIIMVKFVLLLAAGAALGVASKKSSAGDAKAAHGPRLAALIALASAALLGVFL